MLLVRIIEFHLLAWDITRSECVITLLVSIARSTAVVRACRIFLQRANFWSKSSGGYILLYVRMLELDD